MRFIDDDGNVRVRRIVAATAGLLVGLALLGALVWVIGVATADIFGRGEAQKQLHSADFRITAYNHFYDLCASVQTTEAALDAQFQELQGSQGSERDRIKANIAGISAERLRAIRQYNVDARKSYTVGQFRASNLPYQLPAGSYERGDEQTSCEA